jgi:hypothetical protein
MALKGKVARLQKLLRGSLESFELADGRRHYFDPQEALKITFLYFAQSLDADYLREPRSEPPDLLKAVAGARDRRAALSHVMGGCTHLPIDREALVERGEFVPRSLVAGHSYEDLGISVDGG